MPMGGTWEAQNKILSGAYVNFKGVPRPSSMVGDRGIVAVPLPLSWGEENKLIEVLSTEYDTTQSLVKVGFNSLSAGAEELTYILSYAHTAKVFRLDRGGSKASLAMSEMTVNAKYAGKLGNRIAVKIEQSKVDTTKTVVTTFFDTVVQDEQTVLRLSDLTSNSWVDFDVPDLAKILSALPNIDAVKNYAQEKNIDITGLTKRADIENAIINALQSGQQPMSEAGGHLEGGTDGTINEESYSAFFELLQASKYHVLALPTDETNIKTAAVTFTQNMYKERGIYTSLVLADLTAADDWNVISVDSTQKLYNLLGEEFTASQYVCLVAGLESGASIAQSVANRPIMYVTDVKPYYNKNELERKITGGNIVFSKRFEDSKVVIEDDINTLQTLGEKLTNSFKSNNVVRTLQDIANQVREVFNIQYAHIVKNNELGRTRLKTQLVSYLLELEALEAIQNVDPLTDVIVKQGIETDSVVVELLIDEVNVMKKMYVTVHVGKSNYDLDVQLAS